MDFEHLRDLAAAGINWVTRAKENTQFRVIKRQKPATPNSLSDEIIATKVAKTRASYAGQMRRMVARVEVDGREVEMTFITNNLEWSANSVADLYCCRWSIEVFFKQIKQTLQLSDFLGHSASAVRWQIWSALLVYVLLGCLAFVAEWSHSFTRRFTMVRSVFWRKNRSAAPLATLWDSRWQLPHVGNTAGRVSPRFLSRRHGTAPPLHRIAALRRWGNP